MGLAELAAHLQAHIIYRAEKYRYESDPAIDWRFAPPAR